MSGLGDIIDLMTILRRFKFISRESSKNGKRSDNDIVMSVGSFRQRGASKRRFITRLAALIFLCVLGAASFLGGRYLHRLHLAENGPRRGPEITLRIFDLGAGESCLLTTPSGHSILIDGGSENAPPVFLANYLHGRHFADLAILTTTRPRALGGFKELIDNGLVRGAILIPCSLDQLKSCGRSARAMVDAAQQHGIYLVPCDRYLLSHGSLFYNEPALQIASIPVSVGPRRIESMALRIEFGASSVFYAAGLNSFDERKLLASETNIQCDALVLSGEEGDNSPLPELIEAAGPEAIAMSCDDKNPISEEAQSWLAASGATVGRTDILGDYGLRLPYYANQAVMWVSSKTNSSP